VLLLAVALGGSTGGVLRWSAGELVPDGAGFPWTIFLVNVVGSVVLALLPASAVVRRHRVLAVGLGPGLLGGFTTLSTASEQTRDLLDHGQVVTAGLYLLGTLAAALLGVALASRLSATAQQRSFADEGGDE
jgi:CrcB protein